MGNLATWAGANPDTVKHWERTFGLPEDGTYDPEIQKRIENYQLLLNQTPGTTSDTDGGVQWNTLNQLVNERGATNTPLDSAPMRDTAFQAFLRESGAQEAEIIDEIQYRTKQTSEDINIKAAGRAAKRDEERTNAAAKIETGSRNIKNDYENRGVLQSTAQADETGFMAADVNRGLGQTISAIDEEGMTFDRDKRNALGDFARTARGDIAGLYRRRVDEEMKARDRVRLADGEMKYPSG